MEDDAALAESSRCFVNVEKVDFTKSEYPARGIDYIVSQYPMSARDSLQGLFYITLYYRRNPKNKFEKKSHLHQRKGQGAYATHAAAFKDIINHRMELEGDFDEVSPGRWAQKEATPRKRAREEVTVTQLADTSVAQQFASPIPAGRPRTDEDKSRARDALQSETHAECLAAAVTRNGVQPMKKFARVGATPVKKSNSQRKVKAKQRQEENAAAAQAWRLNTLEILAGYLRDIATLPNLIIFPDDHNEVTADGSAAAPATPLSVAQTQRALNQVRALSDFYAIIGAYYPHKSVLECADIASAYSGVAAGITVYRWHLEYMQNDGKLLADGRGHWERDSLIHEEDIKRAALKFLGDKKNLRGLTAEKFRHHMNFVVLPKAFGCDEMDDGDEKIDKLGKALEVWHLQYPVCESTCLRWMHQLGMKRCEIGKCYYTDLHLDPKVTADLMEYLMRDLGTVKEPSVRELGQFQWVQVTAEEAEVIFKAQGKAGNVAGEATLRESAFRFKSDLRCRIGEAWPLPQALDAASRREGGRVGLDLQGARPREMAEEAGVGVDMVEFHVESSDHFDEWRGKTEYGGSVSVRYPLDLKPLVMHGQDESIYSSEASPKFVWSCKGLMPLVPKSGKGMMVSAYVSSVGGFGLPLTEAQLATVNAFRALPANNIYKCAKYGAPQELCRLASLPVSDTKPPLKCSPGIRWLFHGKADDGYWTYQHMMVQAEDYHDACTALWPNFTHIHEYDHSGVHSKKKVDGLDVAEMNADFGGARTIKHNSVITEGCLGPFDPKLKVGDNQHFAFREGDLPPFYNLKCPKLDETTGEMKAAKKVKAKPKGNTYFVQMGHGESAAPPPQATQAQVQKIIPGYVGKAKGMRVVLWERGWLDPSKKYTISNEDESRSLSFILGSCPDFRNEKSAMAEFAEELGIGADATPKGYCELAGRGVEYCWGKSKLHFRRSNDFVATKEALKARVLASLGPEVLPIARSRKFQRKANDYKRAYRELHFGEGAVMGKALEYADIEKARRVVKDHRCALVSDRKFIMES